MKFVLMVGNERIGEIEMPCIPDRFWLDDKLYIVKQSVWYEKSKTMVLEVAYGICR